MRRIILSMMLVVSLAGFIRADDIVMTGPEAEKVKKEILDLLNEKGKALMKGGTTAVDFINRHEVDNILYSGGESKLTKAQRMKEWQTGVRRMGSRDVQNPRVRAYNNGNVAVLDYVVALDTSPQLKPGQGLKARTSHVVEVYVKHNGVWQMLLHDSFAPSTGKGGKVE